MTEIIIVNGPPGCGKDMAVTYLKKDIPNCEVFRFADPLRKIFRAMFNFTDIQTYNLLENLKDEQSVTLGYADWPASDAPATRSPREVLIDISENYIKPMFGDAHLGKLVVREINQTPCRYALINGGGFDGEVEAIVKAFSPGNVFILQIERPGCDFDNDSRDWIDWKKWGCKGKRINNEHELDLYRIQLWRALRWIPALETKLNS